MQARTIRRGIAAAALLSSLGATTGLGLPGATAHTCAQARIWQNGSATPIGSCHAPPGDNDDICVRHDEKVSGTGAGVTVCVNAPVAR
jgi:hypothetical protein